MNGWGVHRLRDMIGHPDTHVSVQGKWFRAVPMPYTGRRLYAAWCVLSGKAYAVQWPKPGDLERAVNGTPDFAALRSSVERAAGQQ